MGKVKSFIFEFTGNKAVFYPGQWVSGDCKLVVNDSLKIKSLGIRLVGEYVIQVIDLSQRST